MNVAKPTQGEDVRTLHKYVTELVKGTNALLNMSAIMEGRARGLGGLRVTGGAAELRIYTGNVGGDVGGQNKRHTVLVLVSNNNPAEFGSEIQWTAFVAADATGTIQFYIDGGGWGFPVTVAGGISHSVGTSNLPSGDHVITAHYSGDFQYFDETTQIVQHVDVLNRPLVEVAATPNPSRKGIDAVTFIANVTTQNPVPPAPELTGIVTFFIDGSNFRDRPLSFLRVNGDGSKTYRADTSDDPINYLGRGDHTIGGRYQGDNNYSGAYGETVLHVKAVPTVQVNIAPNPALVGDNVVFNVAVLSGQNPVPTGTVQLGFDGFFWGSPVNLVNGHASFQRSDLPLGDHTVGCFYSGDNVYFSSLAPEQTLTITNVLGFDIDGDRSGLGWNNQFGLTNICGNSLHVANHNGIGSPQLVRPIAVDSYVEVRDISGRLLYSGPLAWAAPGAPGFQLTDTFFAVNVTPPLPFGFAVGVIGWIKLQIQYASLAIEDRIFINETSGLLGLEGNEITCNCGMTPP